MNVVMYRFNGSSWVPMYPRTTINQVIGLNEELTNIQNQIDNLSPSGGGWTLLYSGSTTLSQTSFSTINLSNSINVGDVLAIELRYGRSTTSYNSKIIITAIGNNPSTGPANTYPHKIGATDFDGLYLKNIYFSAYLSSPTQISVGHYVYLRGWFSPDTNAIQWHTNQTLSVYITRVWKVV